MSLRRLFPALMLAALATGCATITPDPAAGTGAGHPALTTAPSATSAPTASPAAGVPAGPSAPSPSRTSVAGTAAGQEEGKASGPAAQPRREEVPPAGPEQARPAPGQETAPAQDQGGVASRTWPGRATAPPPPAGPGPDMTALCDHAHRVTDPAIARLCDQYRP
jgi:hypothetical protein